MANVGYATLQVVPSLKGFQGRLRAGMSTPLLQEGTAAGEKTGKSFASSFAKFAVAGTAALGAIHIGKGFVDAAVESQKVSKQTEAVLKSMGQTAGLTAQDIARLAEKQSLLSGVDDEVIQSAQNVLLTFGKVQNEVGKGNDVFNRGSQAALDMSVALKQDLQGATIQVGKALNDPVKGITALSRAGVSFTEQQKEQIKTLASSGKTLEAQKIILSELENQFGGSAAAQATAGDRLKVAIGNVQEQIGGLLLPVVEKAAQFFADKLPGAMAATGRALKPIAGGIKQVFSVLFKRDFVGGGPFAEDSKFIAGLFKFRDFMAEVIPKVVDAFRKLAQFIATKVVPALVKLGVWVVKHKPVLIGLATAVGVGLVAAFLSWAAAAAAAAAATLAAAAPVIAIGAAIAALVAGVIYAYENWDIFRESVDAVASFFKNTLLPALQDIWDFLERYIIPIVAEVIEKFIDWHVKTGEVIAGIVEFFANLVSDVAGFVADIIGALQDVVDFFADLPGKIARTGGNIWGWLSESFRSVLNTIIRWWNDFEFKLPSFSGLEVAGVTVIPGWEGPTLGMPNIPVIGDPRVQAVDVVRLAAGAMIPAQRGGVFANIGEGRDDELVLPLSARTLAPLAAMIAPADGWSGGETHLHLHGYERESAESAGMRALAWHRALGPVLAAR